MGFANPRGRDWSPVVNWDGLGKLYASLIILWTAILFAGMGWMLFHRNLYFLKMRNISLAIASTCTLHVYVVKIFLAYTTNGHFPCGLEYWVMGIYLPFGIALFQANLVQLQSVSGQQKKFLSRWSSTSSTDQDGSQSITFEPHPAVRPFYSTGRKRQPEGRLRGLWSRWRGLTSVKRTEILIAVGMVVQLLVTLAIYLASRKFHRSWGSTGPTHALSAAACRRGWEWIPTSAWQLAFSWVYGPYVLFKIKNINDVHYWRLQTTICVISGLPGAPIWLASLYLHAFRKVNRFWVPPMWIAPGIMMMQFCTVFFPLYEAYRSRGQGRKTLEVIRSWEEGKNGRESTTYTGSTQNVDSVISAKITSSSTTTVGSNPRRELYSMSALEETLATNATPLLYFAATKQFTGENVVFLMQLRDWRVSWTRARRDDGRVSSQMRRYLFHGAVEIFATSVDLKTADFPVNIEGRIRSNLESIFRGAMWAMDRDVHDDNLVDPFNHDYFECIGLASADPKSFPLNHSTNISESTRYSADHTPSENRSHEDTQPIVNKLLSDLQGSGSDAAVPIPTGFDEHVFDEAEKSVKYLVLTNTWPKFVDSDHSTED